MQTEQKLLFKIILIGNSIVGKSSFLLKYVNDKFKESYRPTIGIDFMCKNLEFNGKVITLQIWDPAGQERFMTISSSYFKGVNGIFIIYDITNRNSFNEISQCQQYVEQHASSEAIKILVGNKSDLNGQREVTFEEGQKLANVSGMLFIETSAKEGFNVEQAFKTMALEVLTQLETKKKEGQSEIQ